MDTEDRETLKGHKQGSMGHSDVNVGGKNVDRNKDSEVSIHRLY